MAKRLKMKSLLSLLLIVLAFGAVCQDLKPNRLVVSGGDTLGCYTSSQGVLIYNNAVKARGYDRILDSFKQLEEKAIDLKNNNDLLKKEHNSIKVACIETINTLKEENKNQGKEIVKQKRINKLLKVLLVAAAVAGAIL